ncbi:MAG: hypothetical protein H0U64_06815 [Gemmatimonadaceae bacterium]|nr:hypothetical protein [Gemmatimonadaceae bacterium]
MAILGPTGATGSGVTLFFISERITAASPSQAANWLYPWGLTTYPPTANTTPGIRLYSPFAGLARKLRASRALTAGDLTFEIEINGTSRISLVLTGGTGPASVSDNVSSYAVAIGDYITVKLTAASLDATSDAFPQLVFAVD